MSEGFAGRLRIARAMTQTLEERSGLVTARGNPLTLIGHPVKPGDAAPNFHLTAGDFSRKTLGDLTEDATRTALLIVVPSLDTSVCSTESHKFNTRIEELPEGVRGHVISMDLPFAQARWSGAEGDVKLDMLSDFRDQSFGTNYGVLIKENGLLARSIFVIDRHGKVTYVEIVPELTSEPNYDAAIAAARSAAK
jgi:thiol peroxidase